MLYDRKNSWIQESSNHDSHARHLAYAKLLVAVFGLPDALNTILTTPFKTITAFEELCETTRSDLLRSQNLLLTQLDPYFDCECEGNDNPTNQANFAAKNGCVQALYSLGASTLAASWKSTSANTQDSVLTHKGPLAAMSEVLNKMSIEILNSLPSADFYYSESLSGEPYLEVRTYVFPGIAYEIVQRSVTYQGETLPIVESRVWPHGAKMNSLFVDNLLLGAPQDDANKSMLDASNKYIQARNLDVLLALSDSDYSHEWVILREDNSAEIKTEIKHGFGSRGMLVESCFKIFRDNLINPKFVTNEDISGEDLDFDAEYVRQAMDGLLSTAREQSGILRLRKQSCPDFSSGVFALLPLEQLEQKSNPGN